MKENEEFISLVIKIEWVRYNKWVHIYFSPYFFLSYFSCEPNKAYKKFIIVVQIVIISNRWKGRQTFVWDKISNYKIPLISLCRWRILIFFPSFIFLFHCISWAHNKQARALGIKRWRRCALLHDKKKTWIIDEEDKDNGLCYVRAMRRIGNDG